MKFISWIDSLLPELLAITSPSIEAMIDQLSVHPKTVAFPLASVQKAENSKDGESSDTDDDLPVNDDGA